MEIFEHTFNEIPFDPPERYFKKLEKLLVKYSFKVVDPWR